jgi:2-oxoisovalerate dehydrogenase E2 component (dihydrolipoyl transacylase)
VQSDKAAVEITSRFDGQITKLHYDQGVMAKVGAPLVDIDIAEGEAGKGVNDAKPATPTPKETPVESPKPASPLIDSHQLERENGLVLATPSVRRIAREMKVALAQIKGTGRDGRIMKEDILSFVQGKPAPTPAPTTSRTLNYLIVYMIMH